MRHVALLAALALLPACPGPAPLDVPDGGAQQDATAPAPPDGGVAPSDAATPGADASATKPDGGAPFAPCKPLPAPTGKVTEIGAGQVGQLSAAVGSASDGETIRLADGTYDLGSTALVFRTPGVTLRSKSGNREAVVLDAKGTTGEPIAIYASRTVIAHLTIKSAYNHAVHVSTDTGPVTGVRLHDLHLIDPGQQAVKVNPNAARTFFADDGEITCSRMELTNAGRPLVRDNCYTGGVDIHWGRGWRVADNAIEGFWCAAGLSEHAVHVWTGSRDTVVERNLIRNCARGVGFGLGQTVTGRTYPDAPCGGKSNVGHYGGVIRNNTVFADSAALFASAAGFDTGVALEQACEAKVLHNTVFSTAAPFSAIEWRFANTSATLLNNLTSHRQIARDGATADARGNVETAVPALFVDAAAGDLHLAPTAAAAIAKGVAVPAGQCDADLDGDPRGATPDVGADEVP